MPDCEEMAYVCGSCGYNGQSSCPLEQNRTIRKLKEEIEDMETRLHRLERDLT